MTDADQQALAWDKYGIMFYQLNLLKVIAIISPGKEMDTRLILHHLKDWADPASVRRSLRLLAYRGFVRYCWKGRGYWWSAGPMLDALKEDGIL